MAERSRSQAIGDQEAVLKFYMLLFALTQKVTKKVKTGPFC